MDPLMERVFELLIELGYLFWAPVEHDNESFMIVVKGLHAYYDILLEPAEKGTGLIIQVIFPILVPDSRMLAATRHVAKLTDRVSRGGYALNESDHTVRFKDALDHADKYLDKIRLNDFIEHAVYTMDAHFPGMIDVLFNSEHPPLARHCVTLTERVRRPHRHRSPASSIHCKRAHQHPSPDDHHNPPAQRL